MEYEAERSAPSGIARALGVVRLAATGPERFLDSSQHEFVTARVSYPGALLGRSEDADLCLKEPKGRVSREHCSIEPLGGRWAVRDWGSSHGTAVQLGTDDPLRLPPRFPWVLAEGMRLILAGTVILRIELEKPERRGSTTVAGTAGDLESVPLDQQLFQVAFELTAPYRETPPRHGPTPVREIADRLYLSEEAVRKRLRRLEDAPAIAAQLGSGRAEMKPGSRLSGLANAAVTLYPGFGDPAAAE